MSFRLSDAQRAALEAIAAPELLTSPDGPQAAVEQLLACDTLPYLEDRADIDGLVKEVLQLAQKLDTLHDHQNVLWTFAAVRLDAWRETAFAGELERPLWNALALLLAVQRHGVSLPRADSNDDADRRAPQSPPEQLVQAALRALIEMPTEKPACYTVYAALLDLVALLAHTHRSVAVLLADPTRLCVSRSEIASRLLDNALLLQEARYPPRQRLRSTTQSAASATSSTASLAGTGAKDVAQIDDEPPPSGFIASFVGYFRGSVATLSPPLRSGDDLVPPAVTPQLLTVSSPGTPTTATPRRVSVFPQQLPPFASATRYTNALPPDAQAGTTANLDSVPLAPMPAALPPVAQKSLALLLLLVFVHPQTLSENARNPYRDALARMLDTDQTSCTGFLTPFRLLYSLCVRYLGTEPLVLVLFALLVTENDAFRNLVYSKMDIDQVVFPLLELLHEYEAASQATAPRMAPVAILVILVLSSDRDYCERAHKLLVPLPSWFKQRSLKRMSLGSLLLLMLQHALLRNLAAENDRGLHCALVAAFANVGQTAHQMHPYVAQRVTGLVDQVVRRLAKIERARLSWPAVDGDSPEPRVPLDVHSVDPVPQNEPRSPVPPFHTQVLALQDLLAVLLDTIDAILLFHIQHNVQVVYALYHQRAVFASLEGHPVYGELVDNIMYVLAYFEERLAGARFFTPEHPNPAIDEIIAVFEGGLLRWHHQSLSHHVAIRYRHVLNDPAADEQFFLPLLWPHAAVPAV